MLITPATPTDIKKVFDWRNSPSIVSMGNGQTVDWDTHYQWFSKTLADKDKFLLIIDNAGAVRLEREGKQAEVSVYVSEHHRGEGLGKQAIKKATWLAFATWPIDKVIAYIKWGNQTSHDVFYNCGYLFEYPMMDGTNLLVNRDK